MQPRSNAVLLLFISLFMHQLPLGRHFYESNHMVGDLRWCVLEKVTAGKGMDNETILLQSESRWISRPSPPLIQMIGLLHQPITLICTLDKTRTIYSVIWKVDKNEQLLQSLGNNTHHYYKDIAQFSDRMKVSNDLSALTINNLKRNDSGIYSAHFTDQRGQIATFKFNVTVYEPVPAPSVRIKELVNTGDGCNASLHCSVPEHVSAFSYMWKYKHNDSKYQLHNNTENTIHLSLQNDTNTEVLCIVQNPADQKNHSVQIICPVEETDRKTGQRSHYGYYGLLALVIVPVMLLFWFLYKTKKKSNKGPPSPSENRTADVVYSQVTSVSHNDNSQGCSKSCPNGTNLNAT
ncbi:CD48 antigen-like isoform X2 [Hyperolius riggenbachi]|uniref:CD48 antigen-like isoform X2 n=1 Tax=Hyperolius riggenbachi TaxID=752182 RepID=UPI0035A3CBFC